MQVNTDALKPGAQFLVRTETFEQADWEFTFKKGAMASTKVLEEIEGKNPLKRRGSYAREHPLQTS